MAANDQMNFYFDIALFSEITKRPLAEVAALGVHISLTANGVVNNKIPLQAHAGAQLVVDCPITGHILLFPKYKHLPGSNAADYLRHHQPLI